MNYSRCYLAKILKINKKNVSPWFACKTFSTIEENTEESQVNKLGGFAKAFEKHGNIKSTTNIPGEEPTFATLLRTSKFIDLGDPQGRIVSGTIFHVVNDDLYIDFGWKFHCVCHRPTKNANEYVRGAKVKLKIKDLELSTKFLGQEKDLTLLEADAIIIGLLYSPARSK